MIDLLPVSIRETLPDLYSQEHVTDPMVYVKFISEDGCYTWLLTEFSQEDQDTCFGYILEQSGEFGYFSLTFLSHANMPIATVITFEDGEENMMFSDGVMPKVSRDTQFVPKKLSEAKAEMR